ncbi:MAG: LppU/SCO3897 family protein [Sporichthyaceae bacterium]
MTTGDEYPPQSPGTWLPLPAPGPAPTRRRSRIAVATLGGALVVLGVVAVVGALTASSDSEVAVGDCIGAVELPTVAGEFPVSDTAAEAVPCDDPEAAYRVALRLEGGAATCPSDIYTVAREVGGPAELRTLCLTYNVGEGECFVQSPQDTGRFDCASGPRVAGIKILRLVPGVADEAACAGIVEPGAQVLPAVIPEPAMTFCYINFLPGSPGEIPRST